MKYLSNLKNPLSILKKVDLNVQQLQEAIGRIEMRQLLTSEPKSVQENEFKVYSQWGEDGIIQKLIRHINIKNKTFIEFGVQNYTESNTRFLLVNNNWAGLVIDGSKENIEYIKNDRIYWQFNLKAECAFLHRNNINEIFRKNGITGDIGILSIDIDGNDFWIWNAIDSVSAAIVIIEYNARFPVDMAVTVPYRDDFVRSKAHSSMVYYGASLSALCLLANKKGYAFVGTNSAGNNAFFVKRDLMVSEVKELSAAEGYVKNQFRESRDEEGKLIYLSATEELEILTSLPLVKIDEGFA